MSSNRFEGLSHPTPDTPTSSGSNLPSKDRKRLLNSAEKSLPKSKCNKLYVSPDKVPDHRSTSTMSASECAGRDRGSDRSDGRIETDSKSGLLCERAGSDADTNGRHDVTGAGNGGGLAGAGNGDEEVQPGPGDVASGDETSADVSASGDVGLRDTSNQQYKEIQGFMSKLTSKGAEAQDHVPQAIAQMMNMLSSIMLRLDSIENPSNENITKVEEKVEAVVHVIEAEIKPEIVVLKEDVKEIKKLRDDVKSLQTENAALKSSNHRLDSESRRLNLIVSGLRRFSETGVENSAQEQALNLFEDLDVDLTPYDLRTCYWLKQAPPHPKDPERFKSSMLIGFLRFNDRKSVLLNANKLKGKTVYIDQDYTQQVTQERLILRPIFNHLKRLDSNTSFVGNRIYFKHRQYTLLNIRDLPINMLEIGVYVAGGVVYFAGTYTPLSNVFPCKIDDGENIYNSSEQYYNYERAVSLGKKDVAKRVLAAKTPMDAMKEGRAAAAEVTKEWKADTGVKIMRKVLRAKYKQVEKFREALTHYENQGLKLAEATKNSFWACGCTVSDVSRGASRGIMPEMTGSNTLGKLLMQMFRG